MYRALRDHCAAEVELLRLALRSWPDVMGAFLMVAVLLEVLASMLADNVLNYPDGPVKMDLSCPRS